MGQRRGNKKKGPAWGPAAGEGEGYLKYTSSGEAPAETASRELKYSLYQRAVQSPKGDISYLVRFFMDYVGSRTPLHLHEDFCGTALICTEWLRADPRRTAVGLDLDGEALLWGARNNLTQLPNAARGRALLLQGNVLHRLAEAAPVEAPDADEARGLDRLRICETEEGCKPAPAEAQGLQGTEAPVLPPAAPGVGLSESITTLPGQADLVCAFNFSTCCLHTRRDLLQYFRGVVERLKQRPATAQPGGGRRPQGGVFAMDLYGGTSSECALKLQRRFGDFEYTWEQERFDALTRRTTISLHFRVKEELFHVAANGEGNKKTKRQKEGKHRGEGRRVIKKAFSYQWRLWTIPEVLDCLAEAGFDDTKVWMRKMPNALTGSGSDEDSDGAGSEAGSGDSEGEGGQEDPEELGEELESYARKPFVETECFEQCDSWNAYIVGICRP